MKARFALKAATQDRHDRLDGLLSTLRLDRLDDYRAFLAIQARVVPPLEVALSESGLGTILPDWPGHRRTPALQADLAELGAAAPDPVRIPPFASAPAMLGAAYVLEGSRLGARILVKGVGPDLPRRFLSAGGGTSWPSLVAALDRFLYSPERLGEAIGAADGCFAGFTTAAYEVGLTG